MPYFHLSTGLRGCYMPDTAHVVRCKTRRQLRNMIEWDRRDMIEAYGFGESKRVVAAVVAQVWRETHKGARKSSLPYAIGFGHTRSRDDRPFGIFIGHATRAEYLEYLAENCC